jgi:hypothetical protein
MRIVLLGLAVAACAPMAPLPEPTGPCAVTDQIRGRYIGTRFREAAREPIRREANARIARVLRPDDIATTDLREDRLNVMVDDGGQIEGLRCG